jgi:hypothetical protein
MFDEAERDLGGGGGTLLTFSTGDGAAIGFDASRSREAVELASVLTEGVTFEEGVKPICRSTVPRSDEGSRVPFEIGADDAGV